MKKYSFFRLKHIIRRLTLKRFVRLTNRFFIEEKTPFFYGLRANVLTSICKRLKLKCHFPANYSS
jgi:hypothetical protein